VGPFAGHSPERERPLGGYAALTATFFGACAGFAGWHRRSGRPLPDRIAPEDLGLVAVATHKLSRLIAKDRVTSVVRAPFTTFEDDAGPGEVEESARRSGLARAVGELLVCPYCLSLWIGAGFVAGLLTVPRATRWIATVLTIVTASDTLQIAYKRAEESL
jgi:hypothetical protein